MGPFDQSAFQLRPSCCRSLRLLPALLATLKFGTGVDGLLLRYRVTSSRPSLSKSCSASERLPRRSKAVSSWLIRLLTLAKACLSSFPRSVKLIATLNVTSFEIFPRLARMVLLSPCFPFLMLTVPALTSATLGFDEFQVTCLLMFTNVPSE